MKAKKSLGQNFLKSQLALSKIVEAGEIQKTDTILEIGPGRGALTKQLLGSSGKVLAIEKDRELIEFLREKFKKEIEEKKLILVEGDILEFKPSTYNLETRTYKVIANIPYNITGAILKKFLTAEHHPERMILMIQHEVAQRIVARDGKESILSISVKAYGEPKMVMKVPARYFSPAPKVDSAVIAISNISKKLFNNNPESVQGSTLPRERGGERGDFEERFWEIVKKGFAHKRKKLSGNLKGVLVVKKEILEQFGDKRAEDLTLADWVRLSL